MDPEPVVAAAVVATVEPADEVVAPVDPAVVVAAVDDDAVPLVADVAFAEVADVVEVADCVVPPEEVVDAFPPTDVCVEPPLPFAGFDLHATSAAVPEMSTTPTIPLCTATSPHPCLEGIGV